jgi:hypothetical protein
MRAGRTEHERRLEKNALRAPSRDGHVVTVQC